MGANISEHDVELIKKDRAESLKTTFTVMSIPFYMKFFLFSICLFFFALRVQSQVKPHVYYLNKDLAFTSKDSATFTGMGWEEDGHIKLRCFNNINKTVVFLAYCTDSTLSVFDGLFQSYFPNGDVENEGYYVKGKVNGLWRRWNYFHDLVDSSIYDHGTELLNAKMNYHFNRELEGMVVDDSRNGKIYTTYYNRAGDIVYDDSLATAPAADSIFIKPSIPAGYPGGQPAWTDYISRIAKKNRRAIRRDNTAGTCHIRFEVDKDGNISNINVLTMKGTAMAKIVSEAILAGPKWIPAMEHGRKVKSVSEIPISYDSSTF